MRCLWRYVLPVELHAYNFCYIEGFLRYITILPGAQCRIRGLALCFSAPTSSVQHTVNPSRSSALDSTTSSAVDDGAAAVAAVGNPLVGPPAPCIIDSSHRSHGDAATRRHASWAYHATAALP
jgi:hypothetical protein